MLLMISIKNGQYLVFDSLKLLNCLSDCIDVDDSKKINKYIDRFNMLYIQINICMYFNTRKRNKKMLWIDLDSCNT